MRSDRVVSPPTDRQQRLDPAQGSIRFWTELAGTKPGGAQQFAESRPAAWRIQAAQEKALRSYRSSARQYGPIRISKGATQEFKIGVLKDCRRAIDRLRFKVSLGEVDKREVVELLLPLLVDSPSSQINGVFDALLELGDPSGFLDVALAEYDRTGRQKFLSFAVSLLEHSGLAAWPILERLANSVRPEAEFFIDSIAHCAGVELNQRRRAIRRLLTHPDPDVQSRVSEVLAELSQSSEPDRPAIVARKTA